MLGLHYNNGLRIEAVGGYLIYVLLGYLLEYCYALSKRQRVIIYILGFCGWFLRFVTVLIWSLRTGSIQNQLGGYISFCTVFFAIAVFVFFKYEVSNINFLEKFNKEYVNKITSYGLGVYLIHMYFIKLFTNVVGINATSIVWRTLGVILVYGCCLITVFVLKRIPIIRNTVP